MAKNSGQTGPKIKTSEENVSGVYDQYKSSNLWPIVKEAIEDLVKNQDLKETTLQYYIVGYIVKCIETRSSKK
jgi:hypothetical protein